MIKVSVIVPVYNMEKYLDECLTSLINQKMNDVEFLIINDGSSDNSENIIKKYQKIDARIKLFNKTNGGISSARNYGLEKAKGEYVCFVDSDDSILETYIESMYNKLISEGADIVICDYYKKYEKNNKLVLENVVDFKTTNLLENKELLFKVNTAPWNKMYKKSLFNDVKFPNYKYEDMAVIPIVMHKANNICKVNEPLYYYLIRGSGETGVINNRTQEIMNILDILNEYFNKYKEFKEEIEFLNISKIHIYISKQRFQKSIGDALKNSDELKEYIEKKKIYIKKNKYYRKNICLKQKIVYNYYSIIFKIYYIFRNLRVK